MREDHTVGDYRQLRRRACAEIRARGRLIVETEHQVAEPARAHAAVAVGVCNDSKEGVLEEHVAPATEMAKAAQREDRRMLVRLTRRAVLIHTAMCAHISSSVYM